MSSMALWKTHSDIGTKVSGLSLCKPNRSCRHDQPTTLHTLINHLFSNSAIVSVAGLQ